MIERLHVGDYVRWRGNFGGAPPRTVQVTALERTTHQDEKNGIPVDSIAWRDRACSVVTLSTGNWAYGVQLDAIVTVPRPYADLDTCQARYPRLIRSMQWAAILSPGEAGAAVRDYRAGRDGHLPADLMDHGGGEAVDHFGGPRKVIRAGIRCRAIVRALRAPQASILPGDTVADPRD